MRTPMTFITALVAILVVAPVVHGQESDRIAAIATAIAHVQEQVPGPLSRLPKRAVISVDSVVGGPPIAEALAARTGMSIGTLEELRECDDAWPVRRCELKGAPAALRVLKAHIEDGTARVRLLWSRYSTRGRLNMTTIELELARDNVRWAVVKPTYASQT